MGTFAYASPEMLLGIDSGVKVGAQDPPVVCPPTAQLCKGHTGLAPTIPAIVLLQ